MGCRLDFSCFWIAHGLEKLRQPNTGVNGQHFPLQGFNGDAAPNGQQESPQTLDSHDELYDYDDDGVG
jgi:hypothetical protein